MSSFADMRLLDIVASQAEPGDIVRQFTQLYANVSLPHCLSELKVNLLVIAVEAGHSSLVEYILRSDELMVDVNYKSGYASPSPLHAAVMKGRVDLVKLLLQHGASVNLASRASLQPSSQVCTAVEMALEMDNVEILSLFESHFSSNLYTLLQLACNSGALHCVEWLLSQPSHCETIDLHDKNVFAATGLMLAVRHGLGLTQLLLDHGARADLASPVTRRTALHYLVSRDSYPADVGQFMTRDLVDVLRALLAAGCPVNGLDVQGQTALTLLCYHPYVESMIVSSTSGRPYDVVAHRQVLTDAVSLLLDSGAETSVLPRGAEKPFDILTRYLQSIVRDLVSRQRGSSSAATAMMTSSELMMLIGRRCGAEYSSQSNPAQAAMSLVAEYLPIHGHHGDKSDDDEMLPALSQIIRNLLLVSTQAQLSTCLTPAPLILSIHKSHLYRSDKSTSHLRPLFVFFRYLVKISGDPQAVCSAMLHVANQLSTSSGNFLEYDLVRRALRRQVRKARPLSLKQMCRSVILNRIEPALRLSHIPTSLPLPQALAQYLLSLND